MEQLAHMSETHFRRKFVLYMNTAPNEYVNLVRLEKACNMLARTDDWPAVFCDTHTGRLSKNEKQCCHQHCFSFSEERAVYPGAFQISCCLTAV